MPDQAAAPVWLPVSARPEQQAWPAQEQRVLPEAPEARRRVVQLAAMARVDRRPELRSEQRVHPADRFARGPSASRSFRVSAVLVSLLHSERTVAVSIPRRPVAPRPQPALPSARNRSQISRERRACSVRLS